MSHQRRNDLYATPVVDNWAEGIDWWSDGPRPLVLLIDDDPEFLEISEIILSSKGIETAVARSGREGLKQFQIRNPDLVVLDLGMPKMDGLDTLRLLRQVSNVPVIILTGNTDAESFLVAMELGVDDYLTKDMSLMELPGRVELALKRHSSQLRGG